MKIIKLLSILILAFIFSNCSNKKDNNKQTNKANLAVKIEENFVESSLFDRLGGEEGISVIVDQIIETHLKNPVIDHLFSRTLTTQL